MEIDSKLVGNHSNWIKSTWNRFLTGGINQFHLILVKLA
jgi:hypothetical protein